jgi:N-acetylmuramoyl-L-alanine amidase
MRRRIAILLVTLGLVAACGGGASPTPAPTDTPTPAPTDVFVGSPAPSAEPISSPAATGTPVAGKPYKVKTGDTMWAIAQKFGVSLAALRAANPKVDPKTMRAGTVLVIPGK